MKLNEWLNNEIPSIANSLELINKSNLLIDQTLGFAGKNKIYSILEDFRSALFPGVYDQNPIESSEMNIVIGNKLRASSLELCDIVEKVLLSIEEKENGSADNCRDKANDCVINLISSFPKIRSTLQTDIEAAYNGDPAAVTLEEIVLSYPSIETIQYT